MKKKIFDPDRDPYQQLKEHEGSAIIFTECPEGHAVNDSKVRYLHEGKCYYTTAGNPAGYVPSCFAKTTKWSGKKCEYVLKWFSKKKIIKEMEEWDNRSPEEIITHIDFL